MSKDKYDSEIEFNRLMARNKHLEKMVKWYKPAEEWENLKEGDAVIIDNSDSLHDGMRGKFLAHDWAISGYVRLVVAFPDGKHCYYLPTQVIKVYEEEQTEPKPVSVLEQPSAPDLESLHSTPNPRPVSVVVPEPTPEVQPEPEKKGIIDFSKIKNDEELLAENERMIEARLGQVAKMPESVRKKVLSSTLDAALVPRALEIGIQRGIIPAF
jgi:hypothetical protein